MKYVNFEEGQYLKVINGWNYDFSSLPHWDVRVKTPSVFDEMYENPQLDLVFLIYSLFEIRMGWYSGFLAILRNKEQPELMFRTEKPVFGISDVVFSRDGQLACAKSLLRNGGWPIFVFDLPGQRFAVLTISKNATSNVTDFERIEFVMVADEWQIRNDGSGLKELNGTEIETDTLQWLPLSDFDSFCVRFEQAPQSPSLFQRIHKFLFG